MALIEANKAKIIKITKSGNKIFTEQFMDLPEVPSWPLGSQGTLTILNGETIQVPAGSILDYSSIDIQAGGVLEIDASITSAITYIGCTGNIIINGELRARNYLGNSQTILGSIKGENLSFSLVQNNGGVGGRSFRPLGSVAPSGTAPGLNGFGGGGNGGFGLTFPNPAPAGGLGGAGGSGGGGGSTATKAPNVPGPASGYSSGGLGNVTLGNGSNGNQATPAITSTSPTGAGGNGGGSGGGGGHKGWHSPSGTWTAGAGGAGGGYKGKHGLPLYIYALGSITGSGVINLSGSNGFNGGEGVNGISNPVNNQLNGAGASGGGGAGGNGGYLWIRHASGFSVPYSISAGSGGTAGGNKTSDGATTADSQTAGPSGNIGGVDVQVIIP